ncbi:hypothetical protein CAEBREN_14504 [Caenorhabditis brenneri]|uniref:Uncharacterized protein n=1 Tax=Caenorhabditis brenneri TaxID=135651 RepID=G0NAE7_CAEBE|nr:hypothetical protein CAEBREN_14504 [Caenorhabditis brenneri]
MELPDIVIRQFKIEYKTDAMPIQNLSGFNDVCCLEIPDNVIATLTRHLEGSIDLVSLKRIYLYSQKPRVASPGCLAMEIGQSCPTAHLVGAPSRAFPPPNPARTPLQLYLSAEGLQENAHSRRNFLNLPDDERRRLRELANEDLERFEWEERRHLRLMRLRAHVLNLLHAELMNLHSLCYEINLDDYDDLIGTEDPQRPKKREGQTVEKLIPKKRSKKCGVSSSSSESFESDYQEVNEKIREKWENTHKVHLLCYLAHLKLVVKTALDESLVPSLMMSQLPNDYLKYVGEMIPIDVMKSMVKWFADAFRPLNGFVSVAAIEQDLMEGHEARYPETSRLTALVDGKCFETDLDRATLLFCLLRGMELTARIVVNARTIQRKWDKNQQKELQDEMNKFRELSRSRSTTPKNEQEPTTSANDSEVKEAATKKGAKKTKKNEERNYWVEYWQPREKRWICIDPLHRTVDEPLTIHKDSANPISYVFAIDNKQGICEVSQRYAMDCVKQEFRRRRTDPKWIAYTLSLSPFAANLERKKWEAMQMREDLIKRPLPTIMSEYKNHPLYVLEKDLLKFEAIYPPPETQKPLGQIRGHNIYPRSCVFTLQGENDWLKLARSVIIGEEPYKVVKACPDPRVPVEDRVDQFLNVFGFWQTETYRRPPLKEGKIPHNDYGNVYMFHESMCPLECKYLKLPGLVQLSRKLDKQCVPAVVGWAFDGGRTQPVIEGAIVLEKDAPAFINAWEKQEAGRAEKEEKARVDRIHENWRKLIKGALSLASVKKFGAEK